MKKKLFTYVTPNFYTSLITNKLYILFNGCKIKYWKKWLEDFFWKNTHTITYKHICHAIHLKNKKDNYVSKK